LGESQVVAETVIKSEVWRDLPGILPIERGQRPAVIRVCGISETLLVNLRQAKRCRLQRVDGGGSKLWA